MTWGQAELAAGERRAPKHHRAPSIWLEVWWSLSHLSSIVCGSFCRLRGAHVRSRQQSSVRAMYWDEALTDFYEADPMYQSTILVLLRSTLRPCPRAAQRGKRCTSCTLLWPFDTVASRVRSSRPCLALPLRMPTQSACTWRTLASWACRAALR